MTDPRPSLARREVALVAGSVGILLVAVSHRYGYHRDELYFLEAGRHLAWGYPDQPPLVPLLARLSSVVAPESLVALRVPSALAAVAVVLLTALMARELGATRGGQVLAAAASGLCGVVLATGHLLSTATFSLLGWVTLTYLLLRILRNGSSLRLWLAVGVVAGLTLQANPLVATLLVVAPVAVLARGPRDLLRTPGPYLGALVAAAIAAPYLIWQAAHGFPQLDVARGIADGASGTSASRTEFLLMQLLQIGPFLAPIWLTGLFRLLRSRPLRALGWTYLGLAVVFLVVAGKPYYLAGMYPLLFAAGAQPVLDRVRAWGATSLLVLSLPAIVFTLPVLPVARAEKVIGINYDIGETIGWPGLVEQVAETYRGLPDGTVILTGNYGLAGAVDRYGPDHDLPGASSGHMAYHSWGPPAADDAPVLAIGLDPERLDELCTSVRPVGELRNRWDIDNEENGTVMYVCEGLRESWDRVWPRLERYG